MKIVHVISGLEVGGAELMLLRMASCGALAGDNVHVVSLTTTGQLGPEFTNAGVRVTTLGGCRGRPSVALLQRLVGLLRAERPTVVQSWMYHSDLLAGVATRFVRSPRPPVVWGVRGGFLDWTQTSVLTRLTVHACAIASSQLPAKIVVCSEVAREFHRQLGYDDSRMILIPNGIDTTRFRPDEDARASTRSELFLPADVVLIGSAARFHPQKNHKALIRAFAHVHRRRPRTHLVLCGTGVNHANTMLLKWIHEAGVTPAVHLLGLRQDMPRLTAALDLAVCSSTFGEAFPNVLVEAMSCGVPCVSTEVGDARAIIGRTGELVPPHDVDALADAILRLIDAGQTGRRQLGAAARSRAETEYALELAVRRFNDVHLQVAQTASEVV